MNVALREIAVECHSSTLTIAADNDKVWLMSSGRKSDMTCKIKKARHMRDNKDGFNMHTVTTGEMKLPVNIQTD